MTCSEQLIAAILVHHVGSVISKQRSTQACRYFVSYNSTIVASKLSAEIRKRLGSYMTICGSNARADASKRHKGQHLTSDHPYSICSYASLHGGQKDLKGARILAKVELLIEV